MDPVSAGQHGGLITISEDAESGVDNALGSAWNDTVDAIDDTVGIDNLVDTIAAIGEGILLLGAGLGVLWLFGDFLGPLVSENVIFEAIFNVWVWVLPFSMVMEMVGAPPHRSWWESLLIGGVNTLLWPIMWPYRMILASSMRAFSMSGSVYDKVKALGDFNMADRSDLGYWGKRAKDKLDGRVLQWNGPSKEALQHVQASVNDPACSGEFIEDSLF